MSARASRWPCRRHTRMGSVSYVRLVSYFRMVAVGVGCSATPFPGSMPRRDRAVGWFHHPDGGDPVPQDPNAPLLDPPHPPAHQRPHSNADAARPGIAGPARVLPGATGRAGPGPGIAGPAEVLPGATGRAGP